MKFERLSGRNRFGAALATGTLAVTLAGCGASHSYEASASPPAVATSAPNISEIPQTLPRTGVTCTRAQVEVNPGSRFNFANASDIQKQIDALAVAYNNQPVTADNVLNVLSLMTNASIDPEYANAMSFEQQRLASGEAPLTAEELLNRGFPSADCLTGNQIDQINGLFSALVPKLAAKIGAQSAADIRGLYHSLVIDYDNFKQNFLPTAEPAS